MSEALLRPSSASNAFPHSGVALTLQSSYLGCFAHAGFMNALLDAGVRPAKIAGSSSGAIIAAAYASGLEGDALKSFILDKGFQRSFLEWRALIRGVTVFAFYRRQGLIRGRRAVEYFRKNLPISRIEDASNAELSIGVSHLSEPKRQLMTRGELAPLIVASCAIPPIIEAQEIDGELYLDGGFTDEAPFEQWIDDPEIHTIIIHQIEHEKGRWSGACSRQSNFLSCWGAMHEASAKELLMFRLNLAKAAGKRVLIHQSTTQPPKLIASAKSARAHYQRGYDLFRDSKLAKSLSHLLSTSNSPS